MSKQRLSKHVSEVSAAINKIPPSKLFVALSALRKARDRGAPVFIVGNGGSAAVADHVACDFNKWTAKNKDERRGIFAIPVMSLVSTMTAYANDYSYGSAAFRYIANAPQPGSVILLFSVSGTSPNIINVEFGFDGDLNVENIIAVVGKNDAACDPGTIEIQIESKDYRVVEDCFSVIGHYLAEELRLR